ncbi:hypothetical protein LB506_010075 [Fusarium annulatum]|nr:hypothetical protein LB506_010075 [Fusarium annulatum]
MIGISLRLRLVTLKKQTLISIAQILFPNINDMPGHNKLLIVVLQGIYTLPKPRPFLKDFMLIFRILNKRTDEVALTSIFLVEYTSNHLVKLKVITRHTTFNHFRQRNLHSRRLQSV